MLRDVQDTYIQRFVPWSITFKLNNCTPGTKWLIGTKKCRGWSCTQSTLHDFNINLLITRVLSQEWHWQVLISQYMQPPWFLIQSCVFNWPLSYAADIQDFIASKFVLNKRWQIEVQNVAFNTICTNEPYWFHMNVSCLFWTTTKNNWNQQKEYNTACPKH